MPLLPTRPAARALLTAAAGLAAAAACHDLPSAAQPTETALAARASMDRAAANGGARHASASIVDGTGAEVGWAKLIEDGTGRVHLNVHVSGLTPGLHGIHLHAVGSCVGPAFTSAGSHYNPAGHQHGLENPAGPHNGDLPNLEVNEAGIGHLDATTDRVTLSPGAATLFDANGSALVIHANRDDQMTDPTGNSGGRIACGVIVPD